MTSSPPITDAHDITAEMLCNQGGVCSDTLRNHIASGLIEQGKRRPGVGRRLFWTRTQANKWLRRIGQRDRQFE